MKVVTLLSTEDGLELTILNLNPSTINHVLEALEFEFPEIFNRLNNKTYCIVIQPDINKEEFIQWLPGTFYEKMDFDVIYILEEVEGGMTTIATIAGYLLTAAGYVGGASIPTAAIVAAWVAGALIYAALYVGVMYAIGAIMEALSPTKSRESAASKNLLFNGVYNGSSQGHFISFNVGNYLCGGEIIARRMETYSWQITGTNAVPELPTDLPSITKAELPNIVEGTWYRLKSSV